MKKGLPYEFIIINGEEETIYDYLDFWGALLHLFETLNDNTKYTELVISCVWTNETLIRYVNNTDDHWLKKITVAETIKNIMG